MTEEKAAKIRALFLDVDGVMTNGHITINDGGEETKSFNVKDGHGLKMLMFYGIDVVLVTGRKSRVVEHRAKDLGIGAVYQGVADKKLFCRQLIKRMGLKKTEVCCMGDDLPDLGMFMTSGLCIAVADAAKEVREAADFVTKSRGGYGAVREACEWLLKCQNKWSDVITVFSGK